MESPDTLDVLFCDLCNTSVPLQDLERGAARRHLGKTIGACCLPAFAAAAPAATPAAATAPAAARTGAHDARLLPLGIALLAALAALAIFVDYRLAGLEERTAAAVGQVAETQKSHGDVLQEVSVAMDRVAQRRDQDALGERLTLLDGAQSRLAEQVRTTAEQNAASLAGLQLRVQELQRSIPDHGPVLTDLRMALAQQAVTLAELKAMPRTREPEAAAAPAAPVAVPGLSAALAHQVQRLKDGDAATRFEAVDELLRSKDPAVLEHLIPMCKDEDTFVRRLTVEGLKDFRQPAAVDALLIALADPVEIVADTAWRSLKELTGQKLPFEANASRENRARQQQRWQDWWDKNRATFGS